MTFSWYMPMKYTDSIDRVFNIMVPKRVRCATSLSRCAVSSLALSLASCCTFYVQKMCKIEAKPLMKLRIFAGI